MAAFGSTSTRAAELLQVPIGSGEEVAVGDGFAYWIRQEDRACRGCHRLLALDLTSGVTSELMRVPARSWLGDLVASGGHVALSRTDRRRRSILSRVLMISDRGVARTVAARRQYIDGRRRPGCGFEVRPLAVSREGGIAWETIRFRRQFGARTCKPESNSFVASSRITVDSPYGRRVVGKDSAFSEVMGFSDKYVLLVKLEGVEGTEVVDLQSGSTTSYPASNLSGESSAGIGVSDSGAVLMEIEGEFSNPQFGLAPILYPAAGDPVTRLELPRPPGDVYTRASFCGAGIVELTTYFSGDGRPSVTVLDAAGVLVSEFEVPMSIGRSELDQVHCTGKKLILRYARLRTRDLSPTRFVSFAVDLP